jgi:flagellar hook-length control protein FliK
MSVAPDLLLKSAPEIRPKSAAAKAPEKAPEPRRNDASSFAQVYAKERQAKASERSEASAKPGRDEQAASTDEPTAKAEAAAEQPTVADSGNPLPTDPALQEPALDPLLLLGMNPQAGTDAADGLDGELLLEVEGDAQALAAGGSLLSSGPASMTEASFDADIDALNQLPAVKLALEMGKADAAALNTPAAQASQATQNAGQGFASAMAAMGALQVEPEATEAGEVPLLELTAEGLEALKESSADSRPENFVSKLSALSQAIGQQATLAARAPLVPGAPVPMQQGGWSEAVVDRVMWLSSQNLKSAEIQLDPAELGRLEVRINMNQEQTQVTFASPNANVREALEGQMHRLRELFAQQGMDTLDVNVSDQSLSRGWQGQDGEGRGRGNADDGLTDGLDETVVGHSIELNRGALAEGRGMVDYYA